VSTLAHPSLLSSTVILINPTTMALKKAKPSINDQTIINRWATTKHHDEVHDAGTSGKESTSISYSMMIYFAVSLCFLVVQNSATFVEALIPVQNQVKELRDLYISQDNLDKATRTILQRRHIVDFADEKSHTNSLHSDDNHYDLLFQSFAQTICRANAVPRKELWETWAVALYIQDYFPNCRRIADLACGHGLLSWALLVLDNRRTAVCVDKRMPLSADKIFHAMIQEYPQLESHWDFVESSLDAITTSSAAAKPPQNEGTLLCGIHACGVLSDQIISLAIDGNLPAVLLPCCYMKKSLQGKEREEYDRLAANNANVDDADNKDNTLAEFINLQRIKRLEQAGYHVEQHSIPEEFTPQNTIILAAPPARPPTAKIHHQERTAPTQFYKRYLPPLVPVPIDDTEKSKRLVRKLAGRKAAMKRKSPPPPSLCVSLAMPREQSLHVTPSTLAGLVHEVLTGQQDATSRTTEATTRSTHTTNATVEYADDEAFFHAKSGMFFRTFRVTYHDNNEDWSSTKDRDRAKEIHATISNKIPIAFPGCVVRS